MHRLHIDFETKCELDLRSCGLDLYVRHSSFRPIWAAFALDDEEPERWDITSRKRMPSHLRDMLEDESVHVWAFNAAFERLVLNGYYDMGIPIRRFRCAMALAYMHAFTGGLEEVGDQTGIAADKKKIADGKRLMRLFSMPQKITTNQPLRWRDARTDPEDWERYGDYCVGDVEAERAITSELLRFPVPEREWETWALDQVINDTGIPIDRDFVINAIRMADIRKKELTEIMREETGLANPGSVPQLVPWLKDRGYPFGDLRKDTVKIVLNRDADPEDFEVDLTPRCRRVLKLRQQQARTSVRKFNAILKRLGPDSRIRHILQYGGASRTLRWAGRAMQPQNLSRTPKKLEDEAILEKVTDCIRRNDYSELELYYAEPMDALAGLVRSSIHAEPGNVLVVSDLASIESCVIGWVTDCKRLLNVFRNGMCAYKDFATELFQISYDEVTKTQRSESKPAVLGAGYRLGGGGMREGKKTGLWAYAEGMGIELSKEDSHKAVKLFRKAYSEIPEAWYDYENAIVRTIKDKKRTRVGPIRFAWEFPYLTAELPSGRKLWYHKPRVRKRKLRYEDPMTGEVREYTKDSISYMGKMQNGKKWVRIESHGGKMIENFVQAIARDVLREGMIAAANDGFNIVLHVHDEIVCEQREGDNQYNLERLRELMSAAIPWAEGLPLGAAGYTGKIYRKD